jgi:hypothetical protein
MNGENSKPIFRKPDENERDPDPFAEQRAYFAYWEEKRRQRIMEERRNWEGLSVYERARRKYPGSF